MHPRDPEQELYCHHSSYLVQYSSCMQSHESALLEALGARVRARRQERDLTRAALSERAGLSSRFLADVEGGRANISVLKLIRLARALGTFADELLRAPTARTIALLGLRGAGKSTLGRRLAQRLAVPFVELDALIEERAELPLADVFAVHGEQYYRRLELEALEDFLAADQGSVLATGGGIVTNRDAYDHLRRHAVTVWLSARPEDHMERVLAQGDHRPVETRPNAMAELRQILGARSPLYSEANLHIDTSRGEPDELVDRLVRLLGAEGVTA